MAGGDYSVENIYQGGYTSFKPSYGDVFTGYHLPTHGLGAPTKPDTANQIQQVNQLLNQGIVPIEVGALSPEVFDQIPKQHFKEIKRMSDLTGSKISVHAPIVEPSGMGEQGWSEASQKLAEKQLTEVVEKSYEMDPDGNIPITIHSAGIMGSEYAIKNGEKIRDKLLVVDRDSGKPVNVLEQEQYFSLMPEPKEEIIEKLESGKITQEQIKNMPPEKIYETEKNLSPERRLDMMNNTQWRDSIDQLIFNKERADEILQTNAPVIAHLWESIEKGTFDENKLTPNQKQARIHLQNAYTYLEDTQQHVSSLFNKAYKLGDQTDREKLDQVQKNFVEQLNKDGSPLGQSMALQKAMEGLKKVKPKLFQPMEEFALEKSSQTFANVALNSYDKFGDKSPTISIENLPTGFAFSSMEDMNKLITESRNKFANELMEKKGFSQKEAQRKAEKVIGMTLDVGHLNIAKKKGFQDKDLMKEVEQIAKHVKHVHLTDNFGYSDSHLPPGMGNVPFKDILERLEKEGYSGRQIVEAGGFVQHFGQSPYLPSLEAFGSPIYADGLSPYWNQTIGLQQGYLSGYGQMLPQGHFQTYGIPSFSNLPTELGGNRAGGQGSRLSGNPME